MENGHKWSWEMHTERSWKVTENHFHYSVRTLVLSSTVDGCIGLDVVQDLGPGRTWSC